MPKKDPDSIKIANNPFNVFVSWQKYNTSIEDELKSYQLIFSIWSEFT